MGSDLGLSGPHSLPVFERVDEARGFGIAEADGHVLYRERAGAEHLFGECFANLVAQDLIAGACFAQSSSHGSGAEVEGAGDLVRTCCPGRRL